jgi:alkanesulfonate monooxygenase SsuD/methylene tetrahydromethanopterin reductase-like flavin-dependent oxidoreductase (luciferase family)
VNAPAIPRSSKVGISTHFYAAETPHAARDVYPYYNEYLRPKTPGARGFNISEGAFIAGLQPDMALMIGSAEQVAAKILDADRVLGGIDRFFRQTDWGGLPRELVEASISRLATEVVPAVRAHTSP